MSAALPPATPSIELHSPLCWLQHGANSAICICCGHCGAFCGSLDQQLALLTQEPLEAGGARLPALGEGEGGGAGRQSTTAARCSRGCGQAFCDERCRDASERVGGHDLICVGPVTEEHALYRFKLLAFASAVSEGTVGGWELGGDGGEGEEACDVLNFGAKLLARELRSADVLNVVTLEHELPRWSALFPADPPAAEALLAQSWAVISEALAEPLSSRPDITAETWDHILSYATARCVRVDGLPSPLSDYCTALSWAPRTGEAAGARESAEHVLRASGLLRVEGGEGGGEEMATADAEPGGGGDGDGEGGFCLNCGEDGHAAAACPFVEGGEGRGRGGGGGEEEEEEDGLPTLTQLLAEPRLYLPSLSGIALYAKSHEEEESSAHYFPHSCVPNLELKHPAGAQAVPGAAIHWRLSRPRNDWETLTLSRVATDLRFGERTAALSALGIEECQCARCGFESNGQGGHSPRFAAADIDTDVLREIASLAAAEERYEDATRALNALLGRLPSDGAALYSRSRIAGWDDRWSEARELLEEAAGLAPADAEIGRQVAEARSYYAGGGGGSGGGGGGEVAAISSEGFERVEVGDGLAFASLPAAPLLEPAECARAIRDVEAHAAKKGWATTRHYAVPTTDVPVHEVPAVASWFNAQLEQRLCPMLAAQFGCDASRLRAIDAFVVKYDASAQRSLPVHTDQSEYSLTIALNAPSEYEGGGTYFPEIDRPLNCEAGGVIAFEGRLSHGGHPITRGQRYIIAAFLYEQQEVVRRRGLVEGPGSDASRGQPIPAAPPQEEAVTEAMAMAPLPQLALGPAVVQAFVAPSKRMKSPMDLAGWGSSAAYAEVVGFIKSLAASVKGTSVSACPLSVPAAVADRGQVDVRAAAAHGGRESAAVAAMAAVLGELEGWIQDFPPLLSPQRYGNRAFVAWHGRLLERAAGLFERLGVGAAAVELGPYLCASFGDATRIDYGTGHEHSFVVLLLLLAKLGVFGEQDQPALVLRVFVRYVALMRALQLTYKLEPAGSHGVWGLDDYCFLPFLFGGAQLEGSRQYTPESIHDEKALAEKGEWLYFEAIAFIKQVKTGPFHEHRYQLPPLPVLPASPLPPSSRSDIAARHTQLYARAQHCCQ